MKATGRPALIGEFLAGLLRSGNAGANTATDHITVLDQALAQLPGAHRHGTPVLVRADGAGCSKAFLAHIRSLREQHVQTEFTVGFPITDRERAAIAALPRWVWTPAVDAEGGHRDGAAVAELTDMLPAGTLAGYPPGARVLVRRERPHPGARLDAFDTATAGATSASPPTPQPGSWRSWTPVTAPTPASKTASAAARTPA